MHCEERNGGLLKQFFFTYIIRLQECGTKKEEERRWMNNLRKN